MPPAELKPQVSALFYPRRAIRTEERRRIAAGIGPLPAQVRH